MTWRGRLHRGFHILAEHALGDSPRSTGRLLRPSSEDAALGLLFAIGGRRAEAGAPRRATDARSAAPAARPAAPEGAAAQ